MSETNRNTVRDAEKSRAFRKMGLYMALGMGTANSVVMSFTGTLVSGHFSWSSWAIGFGIGWVIGFVIAFIVPMKKIMDFACGKFGAEDGTLKGRIVCGITADLIMTPLMSLVMCLVMMNFSAAVLNKSIEKTESEISSMRAALNEMIERRDNVETALEMTPSESAELRNAIKGLRGSIEGNTNAVNAQKAAVEELKSTMVSSIIRSELVTNLVGMIFNIIVQPIIAAWAFGKAFGKMPENASGGKRSAAPKETGEK